MNSDSDNSVGPCCLTVFRQHEVDFEYVHLLKLDSQEYSGYSKHLDTDINGFIQSIKYLLSTYKVPIIVLGTEGVTCKMQFLSQEGL